MLAVAASVMVSIPWLTLAVNFSRLPEGVLMLMPLVRRAVLWVKLIPRGGSTVIDLIGSALPPALTVKLSVGLAAVMFEKEPRDVVGLPGFGRIGRPKALTVGSAESQLPERRVLDS